MIQKEIGEIIWNVNVLEIVKSKNGKSLEKQRYKCKECGKTFFYAKPKFQWRTEAKSNFNVLK